MVAEKGRGIGVMKACLFRLSVGGIARVTAPKCKYLGCTPLLGIA